jgi:quercetin dioxygenase-like cupin family protein
MNAFENFIEDENHPWKIVGHGISRKLMAHDEQLMIVKVAFETGGISAVHRHTHTQATYIKSGLFEVTIEGRTRVLKKGDVFFTRSNELHGVKCLEPGLLIDVFHPYREDFVEEQQDKDQITAPLYPAI